MRIVLSRKGFDSSAGGIPSPILPDGRLYPLPIPDERSPFPYDTLSIAGESLGKLIADLRPTHLPKITYAHLDPDLDRTSMTRPVGWRPIFGQAGAAQSHLANQQVSEGDLFLFYGWFREVEQVNGRFHYKADSPDQHIIYGWLQVDSSWPVAKSVISDCKVPDWVCSHVHFQRTGLKQANDTVYVSTKQLNLPGMPSSLSGGGLIGQYRPSLSLTADGYSRSHWLLPDWFYPEKGKRPLSYHGDMARWQKTEQNVLLRTVSRGQEFVLHSEDYPKSIAWVEALLTDMIHSDG